MTSSKTAEADWKYPLPLKPRAEGFLPVGNHPPHQLYWQEYGNPAGEPVLFLHGGPGGATSPENARFFNPERYRVVLFDQRGCGKSMPNAANAPQAAFTRNTTQDLITDIERLREHLKLPVKIHVFGGSWGSTLALAYAIAHPTRVKTLILRGIFLCRSIDIDYFYQGNAAFYHENPQDTRLAGTYLFYPGAWKKFVEIIPVEERSDMVRAYARIFAMTPKNFREKALQDAAAFAWSVWEGSTSYLDQDLSDLGKFAEPEFAKAFARIENHYFLNGAFLSASGEAARDNNYILENVAKIAHIPIHIVHGRFDQVCPRFQADALVEALQRHHAMPYVTFTAAGHSSLERETMLTLTAIMDGLVK